MEYFTIKKSWRFEVSGWNGCNRSPKHIHQGHSWWRREYSYPSQAQRHGSLSFTSTRNHSLSLHCLLYKHGIQICNWSRKLVREYWVDVSERFGFFIAPSTLQSLTLHNTWKPLKVTSLGMLALLDNQTTQRDWKTLSTSLTVLLSCVFVCMRVGLHVHVHMCIRVFLCEHALSGLCICAGSHVWRPDANINDFDLLYCSPLNFLKHIPSVEPGARQQASLAGLWAPRFHPAFSASPPTAELPTHASVPGF